MNNRTFYNEVLTDHNRYPGHKEKLADANLVLEGVNPSCGDDIVLQLCVEDGRITEGTFTGDGCAISQASVDIMLDLVIGKTKEEAMHLADLFFRMIKGTVSDEELEELEEPVPWSMFPICRRVSNARYSAGTRLRRCLGTNRKRNRKI